MFLSGYSAISKGKMSRVILLLGFGLAFVTLIHGGSVPKEFQEAGKELRAACMAETGATVDMIEKASSGIFAEDDKLKCYLKCTFDKFKLIDGDEINFDAMLLIVPPSMKDVGTKMIENCRETTGKDICDKTFNVNKCFQKLYPEQFFVL